MVDSSVGKLIWYERTKAGISTEVLCRGICSRSFLNRLESGERRCEKIMFDALLQRVGVSADKFIYIMNPDEQDWLILQEKLIQAVDMGVREQTLPLLEAYRKMTAKKCELHQQFYYLCEVVLEWKNGVHTPALLHKLTKAWEITMDNIAMDEMADYHLSLMECIIRMMYCRIQEDNGDKHQAAEGYKQLLHYLETYTDEEDRVKLYPQIAYRLMEYYLENQDYPKAIELADKAVELLKVRGRLFYMRQFLEVLLRFGDKEEEEQTIFRLACDAIQWLYDTFQIEEKAWTWYIPFGMAEVELCGNLVRARRIALGMSQEKLAEGICDAVTISRIECGKVTPQMKILQKIMERIGMKDVCVEATKQVEQPEFFELATQISLLLSLSKGKAAEPLIQQLESKTKKGDKFTEQYIENTKALALRIQGKISRKEHYSRQYNALHLTMPYFNRKQQKEWRFSRQEVNIINCMSYSCEAAGKTEETLELLFDIKNQYDNKPFQLMHYITGYELTVRNMGNILGNIGKYEQAIEIANQGISLGLRAGRGVVLIMLLYDCGWDMEQLWETGKFTKKESLYYIKASLALKLLFSDKTDANFFIEHLKTQYKYEINLPKEP